MEGGIELDGRGRCNVVDECGDEQDGEKEGGEKGRGTGWEEEGTVVAGVDRELRWVHN